MGEVNAVSGSERGGFPQIIGPVGTGIIVNDNSDGLLSYSATFGL